MILRTLDSLVKAASNLTLREDWCTTFCIVILAYTCVPNMARKTKNPEKELTMYQYTEANKINQPTCIIHVNHQSYYVGPT